MCIRKLNLYALGSIILVLSTRIGKCQSRNSFDSKHDDSDFHETDDTSSDSKKDTDLDTDKSLLNFKDNEQSRSEEILKGAHKNKKKPDNENKHSNSNNDNASRESDKLIRGNLKIFNGKVRYFNNSVTENKNLNTDGYIEVINSNEKEGILLGGPKSNFNQYVKPVYKDLTTKNTERFIEEDEVVRGNPKTVSYKNLPSKHENLKTSTYSNIEDTKQLSKEDDIIIGNPGKGIGTIQSVNKDEKTRNNNKTKENLSKDEVVLGKGKINESGDGIVLNLHLTDKRPRLTIIRNDKNPVSKWTSSEEDEVMLRDIKRVKALRKAYGDACVRVVLKKCFTALKKTLKEVCQSGDKKCKRNFKDEFRDNAIAGCYKKFNHESISRAGKDPMVEDSRDSGRQLSMTCMHVLGSRTEGTATDHQSDTANAETKTVNILRDRYEKACQKATYTKCKAAGEYARDKTCAKYECSKIKKKAIKQTYKKNCRSAYGYSKGSDSE